MTYQLTTLKNGLRVATEFLPGVESVAISISTNVGARYETDTLNGISHLLEHMAFKGTKTRSAKDIAEAFDNIGGQINAYTSMEHTVYYAKVLKDNVALAVEILGDILKNSVFDEDELAREKDVIIQEIAMHHDSPEDLIVDHFDAAAFKNQPLGRSILGTEQLVLSFTRDDVLGYMRTYYTPKNMVVAAAGNLNHEQFVKLAEEHFDLPEAPTPPACTLANYNGGDVRVSKELEQLHLIIGLPAITVHDPRYQALQLYSSILGGGMSSRLFQEVREKRGLAYTVYSSASSYADCGVVGIYAATNAEKAGELSGVLCEQITGMAKSIRPEELARAKNQLKAELLMARENPQGVASWIGRHLLTYGEYRQVGEIIRRIDAVTLEDILGLAKFLTQGELTVAALGDVAGVLPHADLRARLAA
ncbi:MAG: M16 family metallopeptidase [Alphaproteobacteria bacterium]